MNFNKSYRFCALLLLISGNLLFSGCSNGPKAGPNDVLVNGIAVPKLLPSRSGLGSDGESQEIRGVYEGALTSLKDDTSSATPYLKLASAFIAEGRVSGNGGYYSNAAIRMLDKALNAESVTADERFQAYSLKSAALLSLHRFPEALETAKQGLAMNDYNASIYGALVDANVELGHYNDAVQACDRMLAIRPDLRSYSRASYLRQIHGDLPGAITAMVMAVQAGIPGDENTEWARVTLGDLYLANGAPDTARYEYQQALAYRPGYPQAEMGLARAAAAVGSYDTAIVHARTGVKLLPESAYVAYLADLYALKGDAAKATEVRKEILEKLEAAEQEAQKDAVIHNGARELAGAALAAGKLEEARKYAETDLKIRPENIDANELMGWVLYKKGDYSGAGAYADKALATGVRNPATLYKTGLIYARAGDGRRGDSLQASALRRQPGLAQGLKAGAL